MARKISQRAKDRWIKDGERNSSYLYQIASFKYKNNSINCLKIDGDLCYDKNKILEETQNFYTSLFTDEHKSRLDFSHLDMPPISVWESINLEKPFTVEEVKHVVDRFGVNKSPGPDGFTLQFYKDAWEVIKDDLMLAVK